MLLFLVLAAMLLPVTFSRDTAAPSMITVLSTTLITITSCHPTVTDCPGRNKPAASSSIESASPSSSFLPSESLVASLLVQTSSSLEPSTSSTLSSTALCQRPRCNADNCLRAFERGQGQQFCSTFTQSLVTDTAGLPTYTIMCTGSMISRLSSACSCLNNACIGVSSTYVQSLAPYCNADNCLRAFERGQGQAFCSTFTQSIVTCTDGLPSYTTQCTGSTIARVSSACSCLNGNSVSAHTTLSSSQITPVTQTNSLQSSSIVSSTATTSSTIQGQQSSISSPTSSIFVPTTSQWVASSAPTEVFSFTTVSTNSQGSLVTSITQATLVPSSAVASQSTQQSQSAQVFSFTTVETNSQGSPVTSVIQVTLTPSSFVSQSTPPAQSSLTSVFTDSQGNSVTTVIPQSSPAQSAISQPAQSTPQVFSFTTTGTDAQGSTFSSVIVGTFTTSQISLQSTASSSAAAEVFSFTTTGTDAQGSPFSSVVQGTIIPSSNSNSQAAPSLETVSFASTGTDADGNTFTTTVQETDLPVTSTEVGSDSQGNPVTSLFTGFGLPFTSTITGTDTNGNPVTSLSIGFSPAPGSSFTGIPIPTGTPPAPGSSVSLPFPSGTPNSQPTACQPFPTCLFPSATNIPSTCSPFPDCLITAIPSPVQNELSSNCGTTPLLSCILGEPSASCTQWPQCLSQAVGSDICDGFPFPDCLFTLYSPTVTSTIATDPPGLTEISTTRSDWTTNTLYQTKDNNGVVVFWPAFVKFGCPECGAFDWIVGNLPEGLFNIKFTLPGLPQIPDFHLPCIFFCHTDSPKFKPKPPVNDPDSNKDKENDESSTTSSTSSSTSSCATATATDCSTLLEFSVSGTLTTTVTSVFCSTFSQCSATGSSTTASTTTSATSTPTFYFIGPNNNLPSSVVNAFTAKLQAETDPSTLWVSYWDNMDYTGFWYQALNDSQVEEYKADPAVANITPIDFYPDDTFGDDIGDDLGSTEALKARSNETIFNDTLLRKRDPAPIQQVGAPDELKVISQPMGIDLAEINSYAYQDEVPGGAMVYLVDSGSDPTHPNYQWISQNIGEPNWIWAGSPQGANNPDKPYLYVNGEKSDGATGGHGTCMLSKIVGQSYGISKGTQVTIVRIPQGIPSAAELAQLNGRPFGNIFRHMATMDAMLKVGQDVVQRNLQFKAVINLSLGSIEPTGTMPTPGHPLWSYYNLIEQLINAGVVIVQSSGNDGWAFDQNNNPNPRGNAAKQMNNLVPLWSAALPIIVVGAVDNTGRIWDSCQYASPTNPAFAAASVAVWAPAVNIQCARPGTDQGIVAAGTSAAAASVSGLIAYFLSIPKHLAQIQNYHNILGNAPADWSNAVKQYVAIDMSYGRPTVPANPVMYNGEIPLNQNGDPVCAANPNAKRQVEQGAGADTCLSPEVASSMSVASASSASVASVSSASIASVSSASVASVASVSFASVLSVSSAEARSSRIATAVQPSFTGYLGDVCTPGLSTNLNLDDANAAAQQFCSGDWIWLAKGQPPTGIPPIGVNGTSVSGANVTETVISLILPGSVTTNLEVSPDDGAGACSVGGYPRSLGIAECLSGFNSLFRICPQGGLIAWLLSDTQGCVDFIISQSGPGLPPVSSDAPKITSTQSTAPQPTAGVIQTTCNSATDSAKYLPLDNTVPAEIPTFCTSATNLSSPGGPSLDKIGNGRQMYLDLAPYNTAGAQDPCYVGNGQNTRPISEIDCVDALDAAATCQYGGYAIWKGDYGCIQASVNQVSA